MVRRMELSSTWASHLWKVQVLFQEVLEAGLQLHMLICDMPKKASLLGITQTPDQPLTYAQVDTPSPYNTYRNPGLTPTPIASPGFASLEVSLKPSQTDYLFFVANYDGTHVFTKTYNDHLRAQSKIRDRIDAQ